MQLYEGDDLEEDVFNFQIKVPLSSVLSSYDGWRGVFRMDEHELCRPHANKPEQAIVSVHYVKIGSNHLLIMSFHLKQA